MYWNWPVHPIILLIIIIFSALVSATKPRLSTYSGSIIICYISISHTHRFCRTRHPLVVRAVTTSLFRTIDNHQQLDSNNQSRSARWCGHTVIRTRSIRISVCHRRDAYHRRHPFAYGRRTLWRTILYATRTYRTRILYERSVVDSKRRVRKVEKTRTLAERFRLPMRSRCRNERHFHEFANDGDRETQLVYGASIVQKQQPRYSEGSYGHSKIVNKNTPMLHTADDAMPTLKDANAWTLWRKQVIEMPIAKDYDLALFL